MPKKALLLMNMGGATTKAELEMFLLNMFRDPNILTIRSSFFRSLLAKLIVKRRLDASWANYEGISGSPLPHITDELVAKLTEKIGDEYLILPVMCYTKPGNEEAIAKLVETGIMDVTLFPLYPHYSTTTVKSSVESFLRALRKEKHIGFLKGNEDLSESQPAQIGRLSSAVNERNKYADHNIESSVKIIEPFYQDASYNQVIIERIVEALEKSSQDSCHADEGSICSESSQSRFFASSEGQKSKSENQEPRTKNLEPESTTLLFSAHGLPEKIIKKGDPYQKQVEEHVEILSGMLENQGIHFKNIKLAYQSRVGPMKWIGPSLEDTLTELKGEDVLVYPISFTIDNSETIYELHREYREIAEKIGVNSYKVCDCPNTSEEFVESIIGML